MVDRINTYTLNRPRLKKVLGWLFVVIGFVALVAPIIPGAPLVFVGFELLGLRFIFTDKLKNLFRKKSLVTVPRSETVFPPSI
jgi:uncharacterized protein YqgC (DUF456 family)